MYMAPTRGRCRGRKVSMAPPAGWRLPGLSRGVDGPEPRAYYGSLQLSAEASASSAACSSRVDILRHCFPPCLLLGPSRLLPSVPLFAPLFIFFTLFSSSKGKGEPDLHRIAITTCMRSTSEGQKVLNMGPRIAMSIANATRELERIVTEGGMEARTDDDIVMGGLDS